MALSWCKVASNLDSHPKIRQAGHLGREVFLFALRRNAEPGNPVPGRIPKQELADWYVADLLMLSKEDATAGLTAAIEAGLLRDEGDAYQIVAWKAGWGRGSDGSAERTARWRENKQLRGCDADGDVTDRRDGHSDDGDVEERRGEEKDRPDSGDLEIAGILIAKIVKNQPRCKLAKLPPAEVEKRKAKWADHVRLMRERDGHSREEIIQVIDWCQADSFWRGNIMSTEKLRDKWDTLVAQMSRSKPSAPRVIQQTRPDIDDDEPPLFTFREVK